jgi:FkbM family methyltransferase
VTEQEHALDWLTPHGNHVTIICREDTADAALVAGLLIGDEYGMHNFETMTGVALDIGAHIGAITLSLLADFPGLNVVAVEPLPENADLIRRSGASWYQQGRLAVVEAAAGAPGPDGAPPERTRIWYNYRHSEHADDGYVRQNRYIGGMWKEGEAEGDLISVPTVTLRQLAKDFGLPDGFILCKIDAEGAEYPFLSDGAELARFIFGEWHDGGPERIKALLEPTHDVEIVVDHGGTGIFRAFRRE